MTIDNKQAIVKYNMQRLAAFIIVAVGAALLLIPNVLPTYITKKTPLILSLLIGFYVIYVSISLLRDIYYIHIETTNKLITIRFVSVQPFNQTRKQVQVERSKLKGYKIEKSRGGLRKQLILFVSTPKGTAKYPPISISLMPQAKLTPLLKSLNM
jgi:hypothetical protein